MERSASWSAMPGVARSMPVADLHVARGGRAGAGLGEGLEAEQVGAPLGAAVVHELDRLAPAGVREEHDRVVAVLAKPPVDRRADPLLRAVDDAPHDAFGGLDLDDLHVEAAHRREPELEHAADLATPARVLGPPGR